MSARARAPIVLLLLSRTAACHKNESKASNSRRGACDLLPPLQTTGLCAAPRPACLGRGKQGFKAVDHPGHLRRLFLGVVGATHQVRSELCATCCGGRGP